MKALEDFPVTIELAVNWVEMDALGHVNNAIYFRYFEASRLRYLEAAGFEQLASQGIAAVLSRVSCHFIVPVRYPDRLTVGTRASEVGRDAIVMEHFVASRDKGLAAFGEAELVIFDFKLNKKIAVPDFLKKAIAKVEKQTF